MSNTLYVKIYKNRIRVNHIQRNREVSERSVSPFTTQRLLVGNFSVAERLLKSALEKLGSSGLFAVKPIVLIQPMEMIEGGLSEVEDRVIRELAIAAGARKVFVWVGKMLTNEEVINKVNDKA